ncbi:MAG: tryptophan--tRNA ligase, partial [Anaerovoracaceae bacterium]
IRFDMENKPGVSNLLNIYSAFSGKPVEDIVNEFAGCGYGDFKKELVSITQEAMAPIKQNFKEIRESDELKNILRDGSERANAIAEKTIKRVKDNFGLGF